MSQCQTFLLLLLLVKWHAAILCPREKKNTHRDLDGHLLIDTVLVVEVNAIDTESPEASLTRCPDVRRLPTEQGPAVVADADAELGSQLHLFTDPALQRLHRNQKHCIEHLQFSSN